MPCSFKGTSHVCCHFQWNTAPLEESCKVLLHPCKDASLRQNNIHYFQICLTFPIGILPQKWCHSTACAFECNTTSKECCIHSRAFFEGNTPSKYPRMSLLERDNTIFTRMPNHVMQSICPIFFNIGLHPLKEVLSSKTLSKWCCIY